MDGSKGPQGGDTNTAAQSQLAVAPLPPMLRDLFWDYDFGSLDWGSDRDLVTARVLSAGPWEAIAWLYGRLGAEVLAEWITRRCGAGLSPRQLRYWELILSLPHGQVTEWIQAGQREVWDQRLHR